MAATLKGIKWDLRNIIRYLARNDGNYEAEQMKKLDIQLFMIKKIVLLETFRQFCLNRKY